LACIQDLGYTWDTAYIQSFIVCCIYFASLMVFIIDADTSKYMVIFWYHSSILAVYFCDFSHGLWIFFYADSVS